VGWEEAEATVVARKVKVQEAGHEPNYDFVVDIRPSDGTPLSATIHEGGRGSKGGHADPSVGDVVGVLYDPESHRVEFDHTDPRLNRAPPKPADTTAAEYLMQERKNGR
jgi:hypothetical protein